MNSTPSSLLLGALLAAGGSRDLPAAALLDASAGPNQVALVELYTSEGCSSCPPAEAWLSEAKTHPRLWRDFVPLSFHVDYWDGLGWPDRFAKKAYTQRQYAYAQFWRTESVYTPGFVRDGREWTNWRAGWPVASDGTASQPGTLHLRETSPGHFTLEFTPRRANPPGLAQLALLGSELQSHPTAGENSGRRLPHDFVVLTLLEKPLHAPAAGSTNAPGTLNAEFTLPRPASPDARHPALAAWVTAGPGDPRPLQCVGAWWPAE